MTHRIAEGVFSSSSKKDYFTFQPPFNSKTFSGVINFASFFVN
jgi:hypothetical protein